MARSIRFAVVVGALLVPACSAEPPDATERAAEASQPLHGAPAAPVFTLEHDVPVAPGVTLHVIEKLSPASIFRHKRRALLMLTGTFVDNRQYDADVPGGGFNALDYDFDVELACQSNSCLYNHRAAGCAR